MNLKALLKKDPSALTDEEKSFIKANAELLSKDEKTKFADVIEDEEDEEDEEIDEEQLEKLLGSSAMKAIEKKTEALAEALVAKFAEGVDKQRAKVASGESTNKNKEADETTFKFLKAMQAGDTATLKALTTSDSDTPKAGYTIPEPLLDAIMRIEQTQYGLARSEMTYRRLSGAGDSFRVPTVGTVAVFWTDEAGEKQSSQPTFSVATLTLKKLAVIVPMTEELLEDSAVNLTELVAQLVREAIDKEVDLQFFNGSGSPWTGLLRNTAIPALELGSGETDGSDVLVDDFLAAIDALPAGARRNAKFYMHSSFLTQIRKQKDSQGRYVFDPAVRIGDSVGTFLGYPVVLSDAFPSVADINTANEAYALFGDMKMAAVYADKADVRFKMLDQATITDVDGETVINLAQQDMVGLRAVYRVGFVLAQPTALVRLVAGDA